MRIVTWNCNHTLSRKLPRIIELAPDIAIIQECERDLVGLPEGAHYEWVGNNPRNGLGVISFGSLLLRDRLHRDTWSYFLPLNAPQFGLKLLATWAFNDRASKFGPENIGMPLTVINDLQDWLSSGVSVVAGDFNNSVIWDRPNGPNNFESVNDALHKLGLRSAYHHEAKEALGSESCSTYFHTKNTDRPFHIDYVYAHQSIPITQTLVPDFADWRKDSDHVPVVVETGAF